MSQDLPEVIATLKKANKNEVFVVDTLVENINPTIVIAANKDGAALEAGLASAMSELSIGGKEIHLHDWGGVIQIADDAGRTRLKPDVLDNSCHLVFSFTPWSAKKTPELLRMAAFAHKAGFQAMVVMTKKEGTCGKADTFQKLRRALPNANVTYYEDTYEVLRDCVAYAQGEDKLYHVLSPEFPIEGEKANRVEDGSREEYLELWQAEGYVLDSSAGASKNTEIVKVDTCIVCEGSGKLWQGRMNDPCPLQCAS